LRWEKNSTVSGGAKVTTKKLGEKGTWVGQLLRKTPTTKEKSLTLKERPEKGKRSIARRTTNSDGGGRKRGKKKKGKRY